MGNQICCLRRKKKNNIQKVKMFQCPHKTSGLEYYLECCGIWSNCSICHELMGCSQVSHLDLKKSLIRCGTCQGIQEFINSFCRYCYVSWGVYKCVDCRIVMDVFNYRHCVKCSLCVVKHYEHCDKCGTCFCNKKGECVKDGVCSICMERIATRSLLVLGRIELKDCEHQFHYKCLKKWVFNGGTSCPICRSPLSKYINKRIPDERVYLNVIERDIQSMDRYGTF